MRKWTLALALVMSLSLLAGCGNSSSEAIAVQLEETEGSGSTYSQSEENNGDEEKVLIAYFAYSENIGDTSNMEVDAIASASLNAKTANTDGNLQVMAQVLEEKTNGDMFHIVTEEPYATDYRTMLPVAIDQMNNKEWPALKEKVENLDDYDVVYLGTPVWNSELPPALHTFLSENDLSGKTIIPFGIHLGSGFGKNIQQLKELIPDATIAEGFTISASTDNNEVRSQFTEWLEE